MAPQPTSTPAKNTRRQPAARPIKSAPRTGTRRSARLQQVQSPPNPEVEADKPKDELETVRPLEEPQKLSPQPRPVQLPPTDPATISQLAGTKRERPEDRETEAEADGLEGVRPSKRLQEPPLPWYHLTKENLQIFNGLNKEDMDSAASSTLTRSEEGTERTQRSANAIRRDLASIEIHIHAEPPDHIQNAIDRIIKAEVSEKRRSEIRVIAQEFHNSCLQNIRALASKNDFISSLFDAIKALDLKNLCTRGEVKWWRELKPVAPRRPRFGAQQREVDDVSAPPPGSLIKTPRPDISVGIQRMALISALSLQSLNEDEATEFLNENEATEFLEWLQNKMIQHEPDRPREPMLTSVPASSCAWDLVFPFAVVEGKAYATGKIFKAENQASVSGACGLKIQLDLDNLVNQCPTGDALNIGPPLFFTICTQGPIHELWAHWTVVKHGVRKFESKPLGHWNVQFQKHAEDFLVKLNNIGLWGLGPFMKSVVERLGIVAKTVVEHEF